MTLAVKVALNHNTTNQPNDSHCDRIHFFLIIDHCFDDGYADDQPVARNIVRGTGKKELKESIDRCTGRRHKTKKKRVENDVKHHIIN